MLQIGDTTTMSQDAINNYGKQYNGMILTVCHVATCKEDHTGYDGVFNSDPLYDFNEINFSLYTWEIND